MLTPYAQLDRVVDTLSTEAKRVRAEGFAHLADLIEAALLEAAALRATYPRWSQDHSASAASAVDGPRETRT